MKLLIVEGLDRCGKDTLIQRLMADHPHFIRSHFGFPKGNTNEEKHEYQVRSFGQEFAIQKAIRQTYGAHYFSDGLYVWNRSHIGECVYGPMYRGTDSNWIFDMEKFHFEDDDEVYLVYLHADIEFLLKQDDGKSFTTDIEKKRTEARLFETAVDHSTIKNKLKIKVNHGDHYTDSEAIYTVVKEFLGI